MSKAKAAPTLRVLQRSIEKAQADLERLYDQRARAFRYLVDQGVEQKEIARRAGVSPQVVSLALRRN